MSWGHGCFLPSELSRTILELWSGLKKFHETYNRQFIDFATGIKREVIVPLETLKKNQANQKELVYQRFFFGASVAYEHVA
jgi:hypothetical protein